MKTKTGLERPENATFDTCCPSTTSSLSIRPKRFASHAHTTYRIMNTVRQISGIEGMSRAKLNLNYYFQLFGLIMDGKKMAAREWLMHFLLCPTSSSLLRSASDDFQSMWLPNIFPYHLHRVKKIEILCVMLFIAHLYLKKMLINFVINRLCFQLFIWVKWVFFHFCCHRYGSVFATWLHANFTIKVETSIYR